MSSRGAEDEKEMLIADLLHQEQHAVETLTKEPEKVTELSKQIDRIRRIRQNVVKVWAGNSVDPNFWCQVKHSLEASRRIQEIIENSSRVNPEEVPELIEIARDINNEKEIAKENFLSGDQPVEKCSRCAGDLTITTGKIGKSLNSKNAELDNRGVYQMSKFMTNLKDFGIVGAGQAVGLGGVFLADKAETVFNPGGTAIWRTRNLFNVAGGLALGLGVPAMIKGEDIKTISQVAGAAMVVKGVVDVVTDLMNGGGSGARVASYRPASYPVSTVPTQPANFTSAAIF